MSVRCPPIDHFLNFPESIFDIESHSHALTPTKHRRKLPILLFNQTSSISARLGRRRGPTWSEKPWWVRHYRVSFAVFRPPFLIQNSDNFLPQDGRRILQHV